MQILRLGKERSLWAVISSPSSTCSASTVRVGDSDLSNSRDRTAILFSIRRRFDIRLAVSPSADAAPPLREIHGEDFLIDLVALCDE